MSVKLSLCPQCTKPMIGIDYRENIGFAKLHCQYCDLCMAADRFTTRTPGPATSALIAALRTKPDVWLTGQEIAFLAEHDHS